MTTVRVDCEANESLLLLIEFNLGATGKSKSKPDDEIMGMKTVVERREEQDTAGRWVAIERIRPRPFDATSDRKQSFAFK
jgi:hypothetical protein